ncbi:SMP-30/gluconolactonase/LRE family protein [Novosphingobium aquimarinum]|uniref:SMP-30/gluconolactonase/LRE family protein n=1 Tax=Novosphingobium aquimarinum TaxID=2682494 RepID=UPI0012ECB066|nr:SMP-30/gluconolactonase/LRE family protein [Novosphingobium aquimarinum]
MTNGQSDDDRSRTDLLPTRLLRRAGAPKPVADWRGVQFDDDRLRGVLSEDAKLLQLHEGALHAEGPVWQPAAERLVFSDVPNRRLLAWYPDGHVEIVIEGTWFMNGNALLPDGDLVHCEHGRRCISRSSGQADEATPIITHFHGKRLNSPNDLAVANDGAIWFTDPIFGIVMPNQGALADPELDHRSIYRFDPATGDLARMADFEQPNGIGFSPDGGTLYVSDTSLSLGEVPGFEAGAKHEIIAFDVDVHRGGALSNRRFFCHADHGYPDGFAIDARSWVWASAADGVHVWSAQREKLGFIPTPTVVSNCAFGGESGQRLFIAASSFLLAIDLIE